MGSVFSNARWLIVAALSSVLLASCGGGGGDAASAPVQAPPAGTNHAPTLSGTPPDSVTAGQAYSFTPSKSDQDGDTLTFSLTGKPAWMTFNAQTGVLGGTPADADVGSFSGITLSVSDGKATASLTAFAVTVAAQGTTVGRATLNWGAPTANIDGSALTDLAGYKVLYGRSSGNLDQAVTLSNPSVNSQVVENLSSGTWYFAVVSVNAAGVQSQPTNTVSLTI
ncbi:MAG: putative Ig domain-containing protein [Gammaproteobacteria bacterium]